MSKKTLILLYPGAIAFEIMLAAEILHRTFPVEVATPNGQPLLNSNGMEIRAALSYPEVNINSYACVLVPGGDPGSIMENEEIDRILQQADAARLHIGGICAGALVLAKTGILRGRTITHNYTPRYAPPEVVSFTARYWEGMTVFDQPVVVDEHIITAMPYGSIDFAMALAVGLGIYSEEKAAKMGQYYRGSYPF
ncbi:MAG: dimethyladenosine transferase [Herpetosiphonaceae bacterium]|nr:MAG: dimethyladenosine transferase [Herpetosiphonaceae bacterium]